MLIGVLATLMGLFVLAVGLGIVAPRPLRPHEAPPWLLVVLGTMFTLGGVALLVGHRRGDVAARIGDPVHGGSPGARLLRRILGLFMIGGFAVLAGWAAFGSGPRAFRTTLPLIGGEAGAMIGRGLFAIVALAIAAALVAAVVAMVRGAASTQPGPTSSTKR